MKPLLIIYLIAISFFCHSENAQQQTLLDLNGDEELQKSLVRIMGLARVNSQEHQNLKKENKKQKALINSYISLVIELKKKIKELESER